MTTITKSVQETEVGRPPAYKRALRYLSTSVFKKTSSKVGAGIVFAILAFVLIAPFFLKYGPMQSTIDINQPPSLAHPFGTDFEGHDLMSQIVYGAYPSLLIALAASVGSVLIGFAVGVLSGYYGKAGSALAASTDAVLTFPALVMVILIASLFTPTNALIAVLLIVFLWATSARAIRAQVASLKRRPFVDAARTSGHTNFSIITRILMPATAPIAFAYFIINTSVGVVLTTALEFLGVGNPDAISWGSIYYWAQQFGFASGAWWWDIAPGIFITLFVSGLALVGFSVEEMMDPRLRT